MDEKKANELLKDGDFTPDQREVLLLVFALIEHEHEADDINYTEDETVADVLDEMTDPAPPADAEDPDES